MVFVVYCHVHTSAQILSSAEILRVLLQIGMAGTRVPWSAWVFTCAEAYIAVRGPLGFWAFVGF